MKTCETCKWWTLACETCKWWTLGGDYSSYDPTMGECHHDTLTHGKDEQDWCSRWQARETAFDRAKRIFEVKP